MQELATTTSTISDAVKVFVPAIISFIAGLCITPLVSHYLYKWKLWKKTSVRKTIDGREATISNKLHNDEARKTPRMGGIIVWVSVGITTLLMAAVALWMPNLTTTKLTFLSRNQTWLPLFTLIIASLAGLLDDALSVSNKGKYVGGGLSLRKRLLVVFGLSIVGAWWFYVKLGVTAVHIPFDGVLNLGALFIPFFILAMLLIYSGGIIDGVDGLSGGVFIFMFTAYSVIAYSNNQVDLATFCMVIVGGLLAFLWFNIPPARFFLSETGEILLLPIIALPLILTTLSVIIQLVSKKFRNGKKVFLVAPLHNHFMAIGWPASKVTMRYWVFSALCAVSGIVISLIS